MNKTNLLIFFLLFFASCNQQGGEAKIAVYTGIKESCKGYQTKENSNSVRLICELSHAKVKDRSCYFVFANAGVLSHDIISTPVSCALYDAVEVPVHDEKDS